MVRTCRDIIGRRCDVAALLSSETSLLVLLQRVAKPRRFISRELPLDSNRCSSSGGGGGGSNSATEFC